MYKNVLNQCIVALFPLFSSCYTSFLTKIQQVKGYFLLYFNQFSTIFLPVITQLRFACALSVLNSPVI